jgi:hypothetical protein
LQEAPKEKEKPHALEFLGGQERFRSVPTRQPKAGFLSSAAGSMPVVLSDLSNGRIFRFERVMVRTEHIRLACKFGKKSKGILERRSLFLQEHGIGRWGLFTMMMIVAGVALWAYSRG